MARSLIDQLTEPWQPEAFKDEYRDALLAVIEQKAAGHEVVADHRSRTRPGGGPAGRPQGVRRRGQAAQDGVGDAAQGPTQAPVPWAPAGYSPATA